MATPSKGIGRGNNSGGRNNPPGGRPVGAINKKARAAIAKAEREGLLMPIDLLLSVVRDIELPLRDRVTAAAIAAPYVHSRLTMLRVLPDPGTMDDVALQVHLARLERHVAEMPETERAETQFERLLEEVPKLPVKRQEAFFRRALEAIDAGLQRLNDPDRPGAVRPSSAHQGAPETTPGPIRRPGTPAPSDERRLRYDPVTKTLEPV